MSNIRVAQAGMQYVPALERPACGNCTHRRPAAPGTQAQHRCSLGGFNTSYMAICAKHVPLHVPTNQKGSS